MSYSISLNSRNNDNRNGMSRLFKPWWRRLLSKIFRSRRHPLELSNRKQDCYVWVVRKGRATEMTEWINDLYIEHTGRPPAALHICVEEVTDIQKFTKGEIRTFILPWLEE